MNGTIPCNRFFLLCLWQRAHRAADPGVGRAEAGPPQQTLTDGSGCFSFRNVISIIIGRPPLP